MPVGLEARLVAALGGSPLAARLPDVAEAFLERRSGDPAAGALEGAVLRGLGRALATSGASARYLAHRPALLERIAHADAGTLRGRGAQLPAAAAEAPDDLEQALDALRLLRQDETLLAACLDLGGVVPFTEVSAFLSQLAEAILGEALQRAARALRSHAPGLGVLGMGKIGGREFTYHSDLDLIFLHHGGVEVVADAGRLAQRLISYLGTRTGAGVAYAVDSRLRPSGNQGLLVTPFDAFARYQREEAQTWEHLALMRARAVAGDVPRAQSVLDGVRAGIVGRGAAHWPEVAAMRGKVESQRGGGAGRLAFKTGAGGLMDVDFLAAGAWLERGRVDAAPPLPGNPELLRAAAPGARTESLLEAYATLRRFESRARWAAGRALETLDEGSELERLVAGLWSDAGVAPEALRDELARARGTVRAAFATVVSAGSVRALDES